MARVWQLQEAKSRFGEMVAEAIAHGPQIITRRGVETVVVLSYAEYQAMLARQKPLSAFFRESPFAGAELDLARNKSELRDETVL